MNAANHVSHSLETATIYLRSNSVSLPFGGKKRWPTRRHYKAVYLRRLSSERLILLRSFIFVITFLIAQQLLQVVQRMFSSEPLICRANKIADTQSSYSFLETRSNGLVYDWVRLRHDSEIKLTIESRTSSKPRPHNRYITTITTLIEIVVHTDLKSPTYIAEPIGLWLEFEQMFKNFRAICSSWIYTHYTVTGRPNSTNGQQLLAQC